MVKKLVEGGLEFLVALVGLVDLGDQALGQFRDAVLELGDRLVKALDVRLGVGEELVEQVGDLLLVGQVEAVALAAVLKEDGLAGVLEDGVVERIALGDFLRRFPRRGRRRCPWPPRSPGGCRKGCRGRCRRGRCCFCRL